MRSARWRRRLVELPGNVCAAHEPQRIAANFFLAMSSVTSANRSAHWTLAALTRALAGCGVTVRERIDRALLRASVPSAIDVRCCIQKALLCNMRAPPSNALALRARGARLRIT